MSELHRNREAGSAQGLRARRALFVFLLLSAAVHAGVALVVPAAGSRVDPPAAVLEVRIERPQPLPVAEPDPPPRPPEPRRAVRPPAPRPHRAAPAPARQPAAAPSPAILALHAHPAAPEIAFSVPAPTPMEPAPPAPVAAPAPPVEVGVAPPSFNAAYLRNPAPRYPLAARRAGEQGTVMLRVLVRPDGIPSRVEIEKTSGSEHLDNAAMEAVKGWRFTPARRGAEPIEGWVLVPIVFRLQG